MSHVFLSPRSPRARFIPSIVVAAFVFSASSMFGSIVSAALINFSGTSADGHPVSGSAKFTLNAAADTILVELTNTTSLTLDAGELFTGLDFSLGGLTPTMTTDTGIQRNVAANGTFTDTGSPQNLSWSLVSLGGSNFQLNFNPNSKDSIIGPPTAGSYATAGPSIKDNNGHNPFAAQVAKFQLSVPGLEANTPLVVSRFRYGTTLAAATGTMTTVPEPASFVPILVGLATLVRLRRR
jgi:hypothetical protein